MIPLLRRRRPRREARPSSFAAISRKASRTLLHNPRKIYKLHAERYNIGKVTAAVWAGNPKRNDANEIHKQDGIND
jgi:hypothetical protein